MRLLIGSGLGCLALAGALAVTVRPAAATQDYAKAEGKDCGHCHVDPRGAGPRNATGQEYEANGHRFGVQSWTGDETRKKFLRASSALNATWYGEAARLLSELEKEEKLPGGTALVTATKAKFGMFPRTWLRAAKTLLAKGERGLPNAFDFLAKLESQFPETDEGKEAAKTLDEAAADTKDESKPKAAVEARAKEKVRVLVLRGRTEWDQGNPDAAKKLFADVAADPRGKAWELEIQELLAGKGRKEK